MRLADLALFRQAAYRLFGGAFLYPAEERLGALRAAAQRLQGRSRRLAAFAFYLQWSRFLRALAGPPAGDRAALEEAYTRLFLVSPDGVCPPYASHYLNPLAPAEVLAAVEGEYARAGLALAPGRDEPVDHAAVELEFLSFLCGREARAWRARRLREGAETLRGQARFLATYVSSWFPEFARRVAGRERDGFYALAADAIAAFVHHDRDLLAALLDRYCALPTMGVLREQRHSPRGGFGRGGGPPLPVGPAGRAPRLPPSCKRGSLPRERSVAGGMYA